MCFFYFGVQINHGKNKRSFYMPGIYSCLDENLSSISSKTNSKTKKLLNISQTSYRDIFLCVWELRFLPCLTWVQN